MKRLLLLFLVAISYSCTYTNTEPNESTDQNIPGGVWSEVDTIDIAAFNNALEEGKPTLDVGV